jgi:hypothetical protein
MITNPRKMRFVCDSLPANEMGLSNYYINPTLDGDVFRPALLSTGGLCRCTHPVISIHHRRGCGDIGRPIMLRKTREKDKDGNVVWSKVDPWKKSKSLASFGLHDCPREPRVIAIFEGWAW